MEKNKNRGNRFVFILVIFLLMGCAYTAKRTLPENYKTISIIMFTNKTFQNKLENTFSDKIIEEFIMDGRLKVNNKENADCIFSGEISQYIKQPVSTDKNKNILEYRLSITINAVLKDSNNNVIWEGKDIKESYNYYTERQTEQEVIDRLIKNISKDLVVNVIERE